MRGGVRLSTRDAKATPLDVATEALLAAPPRSSERIDLAVEVTMASDTNFFAAITENVSEGGVFVATEDLLPLGTRVSLSLSLPDGSPIAAEAIVRWCRPPADPEGPGMGLQFAVLSSQDAARIVRFTAQRPPMYWDPSPGPEPEGADAARVSRGLPREIALRYVPIIRSLAMRLARRLPPHVLIEDLVGAGFVGLVEAYSRYEPALRDRFDAYALVRIRGAMLDELRSVDPLPRSLRSFARRAREAIRLVESRLKRSPQDAEVAEALDMPLADYRSRMASLAARSGAYPGAGDHDPPDVLDVAGPDAVDAEEDLVQAEAMRALATAIEGLPPRLRQVVQLYYGDELTLRDIGGVLGVTEGRVSQLHAEAIQRVRDRALRRSRSST